MGEPTRGLKMKLPGEPLEGGRVFELLGQLLEGGNAIKLLGLLFKAESVGGGVIRTERLKIWRNLDDESVWRAVGGRDGDGDA